MKIVIFGGTSEGRELSHALAKAGAEVIVSVVSEVGAEEQGAADGVKIEVGPKEEDEIRAMIADADLVVDATHPYAVIVTDNIRRAAEAEGVERLRLLRDESNDAAQDEWDANGQGGASDTAANGAQDNAQIYYVGDAREAAAFAEAAGGRVLLTTGSKELGVYAQVLDPELLYPRVLPVISSIQACEDVGIPHRNIIAVQGPFSEALNRAVLQDYRIDLMITKDSGKAGGFAEKIRAARSLGVPVCVIRRPEEEGMSFDQILAFCREKLQ